MVVKRLLIIEKMTIFLKKVKEIYKYIRIKTRRLEASLYISILAHIRIKRQLIRRGPTLNERIKKFHLRPMLNYYTMFKYDNRVL